MHTVNTKTQLQARSHTDKPAGSNGFVQMPKLVLHAPNLSRDAKLLYAILLSYAWQTSQCFPGYRRLCGDMQASENMVRRYMRELAAVGLLQQKRRGLGQTNFYTLADPRTSILEVLEPQKDRVLDDAKSAAKRETREEERDINLRNSKRSVSARRNWRASQRPSCSHASKRLALLARQSIWLTTPSPPRSETHRRDTCHPSQCWPDTRGGPREARARPAPRPRNDYSQLLPRLVASLVMNTIYAPISHRQNACLRRQG